MSFIEVKNLNKTYSSGNIEVQAVKNVSFEIEKGEVVVIVGASGAGKTTLLNVLGGMDTNNRKCNNRWTRYIKL